MELENYGKESAGIDEAYRELTRQAFAVWVRLMTIPHEELEKGQTNLARILGFKFPQKIAPVKELARKGYIKTIKNGCRPMKIVIIKRLVLKGDDHVIKLG